MASMLKYAAHLSKCPDEPCPHPEKFQPGSRTGFRFVHKAAIKADFDPPAIKYGVRRTSQCESFALSFYVDLDSARRAYQVAANKLSDRVDVAARFGGYIGTIDLTTDDGVMGMPNGKGHFDLHPESGATFTGRVTNYDVAVV